MPDACVFEYKHAPWACALLNFSLPTIKSDVFVSEMISDNVQMRLHSGVPELNSFTATYVADFASKMKRLLELRVVGKGRNGQYGKTGLFAPNCYLHTKFEHLKPLIDGQTYLSAFARWLYSDESMDSYLLDDVLKNMQFEFNPTCPEASLPHEPSLRVARSQFFASYPAFTVLVGILFLTCLSRAVSLGKIPSQPPTRPSLRVNHHIYGAIQMDELCLNVSEDATGST